MRISPANIAQSSKKICWWQCPKSESHCFLKAIRNMVRCSICPLCAREDNCVATVAPQLIAEFHPTRNGSLTPWNTIATTSQMVWWACPKNTDHVWTASALSRARLGGGCPFCLEDRARSESLATQFPLLAKQFHPIKNGSIHPSHLLPNSKKMVWWQCETNSNHIWKAMVRARTNAQKSPCAYCSLKKTLPETSLETKFPAIAKEFHPTKNKKLTATNVHFMARKKIWWKCLKSDNHEWKQLVAERTLNGKNCPCCEAYPLSPGRKFTISKSLGMVAPDLAALWHPTKNGAVTPFKIPRFYSKPVWWKQNDTEVKLPVWSVMRKYERLCLAGSNMTAFRLPKPVSSECNLP
eukprot:867254_1